METETILKLLLLDWRTIISQTAEQCSIMSPNYSWCWEEIMSVRSVCSQSYLWVSNYSRKFQTFESIPYNSLMHCSPPTAITDFVFMRTFHLCLSDEIENTWGRAVERATSRNGNYPLTVFMPRMKLTLSRTKMDEVTNIQHISLLTLS